MVTGTSFHEDCGGAVRSGLGGSRAPDSIGKTSIAEVPSVRSGQALRLRATGAVSGSQSVRRSAQDDDSAGKPEEKQQYREAVCEKCGLAQRGRKSGQTSLA